VTGGRATTSRRPTRCRSSSRARRKRNPPCAASSWRAGRSFKASVASRRAIIPAIGYYEWQTNPVTKKKTPYFIHARDGELLGFAGLYAWWADPALERDDPERWHLTATILTSDAVQTLADIHDRNPVPLPRDLWDHWVDPTVVGDQALLDEAVRAALPVAGDLVFDRVGPVTGDGPELIRPVPDEA
jgi:putative SOS response-associated peptidase YedK